MPQWQQEQMFTDESNTWVQVGLRFDPAASSLHLFWQVVKREWPGQVAEGDAPFNFTENGLKAALEKIWEVCADAERDTCLPLAELEYFRESAPF